MCVTEENSGYNSNLCYVLAQRTEGEAFDVVKNVAGQNGGEAWRKLCRRFTGKTGGKRLHLIRKCENPTRVKKLNEVTGMFGEVGDEHQAFEGRLQGGVQ